MYSGRGIDAKYFSVKTIKYAKRRGGEGSTGESTELDPSRAQPSQKVRPPLSDNTQYQQ